MIRGYTIGQVNAFMVAIERLNCERRIGEATAIRMASAEGKAFKGYIKTLERGSNG